MKFEIIQITEQIQGKYNSKIEAIEKKAYLEKKYKNINLQIRAVFK